MYYVPGEPKGSPYCFLGKDHMRARVFIDFWNFQLAWNNATAKAQCNWTRLPQLLVNEAGRLLQNVGVDGPLSLEETIVHASIEPVDDRKLAKWLNDFLDRQPSFNVKVRERRSRAKSIHCRQCRVTTETCPACGEPYVGRPEKGVDAALVTDLLALAWQGSYDVAILVSSDADFVPAVEHVQDKGLKVINAGWRNSGHALKQAAWANFELDRLTAQLTR